MDHFQLAAVKLLIEQRAVDAQFKVAHMAQAGVEQAHPVGVEHNGDIFLHPRQLRYDADPVDLYDYRGFGDLFHDEYAVGPLNLIGHRLPVLQVDGLSDIAPGDGGNGELHLRAGVCGEHQDRDIVDFLYLLEGLHAFDLPQVQDIHAAVLDGFVNLRLQLGIVDFLLQGGADYPAYPLFGDAHNGIAHVHLPVGGDDQDVDPLDLLNGLRRLHRGDGPQVQHPDVLVYHLLSQVFGGIQLLLLPQIDDLPHRCLGDAGQCRRNLLWHIVGEN